MVAPVDFRRVLGHFATGVTILTTTDAEARPIRKVGIVGAGLMATQLATFFLRRLEVPIAINLPGPRSGPARSIERHGLARVWGLLSSPSNPLTQA